MRKKFTDLISVKTGIYIPYFIYAREEKRPSCLHPSLDNMRDKYKKKKIGHFPLRFRIFFVTLQKAKVQKATNQEGTTPPAVRTNTARC